MKLETEAAIRQTIRSIPRGRVSTYGEVAKAAGYPGYHRQVAQILSKCGDTLPWHRVLGSGGQIKTSRESALDQRDASGNGRRPLSRLPRRYDGTRRASHLAARRLLADVPDFAIGERYLHSSVLGSRCRAAAGHHRACFAVSLQIDDLRVDAGLNQILLNSLGATQRKLLVIFGIPTSSVYPKTESP